MPALRTCVHRQGLSAIDRTHAGDRCEPIRRRSSRRQLRGSVSNTWLGQVFTDQSSKTVSRSDDFDVDARTYSSSRPLSNDSRFAVAACTSASAPWCRIVTTP